MKMMETKYDSFGTEMTFDVLGNVRIDHDAEISLRLFGSNRNQLHGTIFHDKAGRFEDGTDVTTSVTQRLISTNDGYYAITLNTTYKIIDGLRNSLIDSESHMMEILDDEFEKIVMKDIKSLVDYGFEFEDLDINYIMLTVVTPCGDKYDLCKDARAIHRVREILSNRLL